MSKEQSIHYLTSLLKLFAVLATLTSCHSGARTVGEPASAANLSPAPLVAVRGEDTSGILVDIAGGEVLLRGVNVNSHGEYWQYLANRAPVFDFNNADMDVLAAQGFNFVRLIVTWSTVEPEPGVYDDAYLVKVDTTIRGLWSRGIYTLIDLHQDAWGPTLAAREGENCATGSVPANGWDGAPGWATLTAAATPRCAPAPDGEPNREGSPAVREAWIAFLNNAVGPGDVGLQDRYAAMLEHLAYTLGGLDGVMGYDIVNEPNAFQSDAEYRGLENLYRIATSGLRKGEARAGIAPRIIVFEPSGIWAHLPEGGTVEKFSDDPQLAYGPHIYQGSISSQPLNDDVISRIRTEAAGYGGVPVIIGEWGADLTTDSESTYEYFRKMIEYQDEEHWGAALWQYQTACGDPHVVKTPPEDIVGWGLRKLDCMTNEQLADWNHELLSVISRPALHVAPGTIAAFHWNPGARELVISGNRAADGNELVLFVPGPHRDLQYSSTGLGAAIVTAIYGGRRITAAAEGGSWSIKVAPKILK